MTTNVYVLRLEGGHYYIGKSENVMARYQQHLEGTTAWTRKYKPLSVERILQHVSHFEEDKITKEYMAKYGIDKVRGGSYCEVVLDDFKLEALQMELRSAKNLCTRCGRPGHFVKDCYASTDVHGRRLQPGSESESEVDSDSNSDESDWESDFSD